MDPGELSVEWNEQGAPRLRAQVKHFCCFGYATAPDEDGCTVTQHWGNSVAVVNATNCVAHLTQFSTSFETGSERTNSCTLTFCDASASFATAKKTEQVLLPNIGPSETVTRRTTLYEATGGKRMQLIVCFLPDRVIPARAVPAPGTQDTLVSRVRALGGWSRHSSSPGAGVQTASPSVSTSPLPGARTPAAVTTSATSPHPGGMGPQAAATACAAANSVTLLQPGAKATQPAATTSVTSQHPGGTGPQPAATSAPTAPQPRVAGSQGAATSSVTSPQPAGVGTQVAPFSSVASPSPGTEDGSEEMVYCLKKIVPMWSRLTILPDIMEPHMINRRIKIKKYAHALETYAMMLAEFGVTVPPQPGS